MKAKKSAAKKTTDLDIDEVEKKLLAIEARRQFIGESLNMGWKLAFTVVIPLVGGVKLDEALGSSPSFTLAGIILAAGAGSSIVWRSVKDVNEQQAEAERELQAKKSKRGKSD